MAAPFFLDDAELRARENSETFPIPSREMRERLLVGDLVKLMFSDHDPADGRGVERMWVEVTRIVETGYEGRLDSEPAKLANVKCGDAVVFAPRHVIGIWVEAGQDWEDRMANVRHRFTTT